MLLYDFYLDYQRIAKSFIFCISLGLHVYSISGIYQASPNIVVIEFNSSIGKFGKFYSPNWPEKYPQNIRYIYIFRGRLHEQVHIEIIHFNIEGLSNICKKDFLDIYTDVDELPAVFLDERVNVNFTGQFLQNQRLLGRFCGHNLEFIPQHLVSTHHILILDLFSDVNTQYSYNQDGHMGKLGFLANFNFKSNQMYSNYQASHSLFSCYFLINFNYSKHGEIQSPNYPSISNFPLKCVYEFQSILPQHRIELKFEKFDLFQLTNTCPIESIDIIDGRSNDLKAPYIVHKMCGIKSQFHVVSTRNRLTLRFNVLAGRDFLKEPHDMSVFHKSLTNTGFQIKFRFLDNLLSSFIPNRILGTECDVFIKSVQFKRGIFSSPIVNLSNSKRPSPIICRYFFFGEHNSQRMEVVVLNFTRSFIPQHLSVQNCSSNSISIYSAHFKVENLITKQRIALKDIKPFRVFCGVELDRSRSIIGPTPVTIIEMKLNPYGDSSENIRKYGFELNYKFIKDYGISGQSLQPGTCHYRYESLQTNSHGLINSPFYNNFYPHNASCQYDLIARSDEMIRVVFIVFQTTESVSSQPRSYHDLHLACREDYLSISEIVKHGEELQLNVTEKYCGTSLPGLLVSQLNSMGLILKFISNSQKNGPGFLAKYQFLKKRKLFNDCGQNISLAAQSGIIVSPNHPNRYISDLICEWHLSSSNILDRVILLFTNFQIEGTIKSCSNSVLRIHEGNNVRAQSELCGTDSAIPSYVSSTNFIRIRFLTDSSAVGAKGFRIVWTRNIPLLSNGTCLGYKCIYSGHCIDRNLTCNKQNNCGSYINISGIVSIDLSDEVNACPVIQDKKFLYTGIAIVAVIFSILSSIVIVYLHKNKHLMSKKYRQKQKQRNNNRILNSLSTNNNSVFSNNLHSSNQLIDSVDRNSSLYRPGTQTNIKKTTGVAFNIPAMTKHLSLSELPSTSQSNAATYRFVSSNLLSTFNNTQYQHPNEIPVNRTINQHKHKLTNWERQVDQLDVMSELGVLTREQTQKISMV